MQGKTHTLGGSALALGGYLVLRESGLLNLDLNPSAQILIILPYAVWASKVPDLDQDNLMVALESPVNLLIQKFFNLIGAGHRSFKSHVWPALIFCALTALNVLGIGVFRLSNSQSACIYCMVVLGISMGLASHALLDMCTKSGLRHRGKRYAFVPELDVFKIGSVYESYVRIGLYVINVVLMVLLVVL